MDAGKMEYRQLGRSGMKVSALCMGTMQFGWTADENTSFRILDIAFERGINFIDTANVYSKWVDGNPGGVSESIIGNWLRQRKGRREKIVIATKVRASMGETPNDEGLSRRHILQEIEKSLTRLGTDYVDLYQLHWPDETTPIEETLRSLDDLVHQGLIRYIGCSNFKAWQLVQVLWTSDKHNLASFVSLQPHYNLVHRDEYERELEDVCTQYSIGVIPYSPLAGGYLTGKYMQSEGLPKGSRAETSDRIQTYISDNRSNEILRGLLQLSEEKESTPSRIALGWLLSRPAVSSAIIGPKNEEQLIDNLACLELQLDSADLARLDVLSAAGEDS